MGRQPSKAPEKMTVDEAIDILWELSECVSCKRQISVVDVKAIDVVVEELMRLRENEQMGR